MILPPETAFLRDPFARQVSAVLEEAGHQALFVGGCVRNAVLGTALSDVDMSTDARPERVIDLAEAAGLRAVPTGIDHGTVTLVGDGAPIEVTTFRRDVETDGRRAVVAFSESIDEDAARRDFTMNALYARPDGAILDPVGGLGDARAGRVVFINDARARIREDYLRVLRFFRFWAWYAEQEAGFDPETLAAIADTLDGLTSLSAERVGSEMLKLLSAPRAAFALSVMDQVGVLAKVAPVRDTGALLRLEAMEELTGTEPDAVRRLAALGPEDAETRLRLRKRDARDMTALRESVGSGYGPKALGFVLGESRGWDAVLLRAAMFECAPEKTARADVSKGAAARFPVQATDLMPKFEGAALGQELARLRENWLKSDLTQDKNTLMG